MVVSASPYEHMIGKPNVKYVANMHGELELLCNAIFNIFFFFIPFILSDPYRDSPLYSNLDFLKVFHSESYSVERFFTVRNAGFDD